MIKAAFRLAQGIVRVKNLAYCRKLLSVQLTVGYDMSFIPPC